MRTSGEAREAGNWPTKWEYEICSICQKWRVSRGWWSFLYETLKLNDGWRTLNHKNELNKFVQKPHHLVDYHVQDWQGNTFTNVVSYLGSACWQNISLFACVHRQFFDFDVYDRYEVHDFYTAAKTRETFFRDQEESTFYYPPVRVWTFNKLGRMANMFQNLLWENFGLVSRITASFRWLLNLFDSCKPVFSGCF